MPSSVEKVKLKIPGGASANGIPEILVLFMWAKALGEDIVHVELGHPSAAVNSTICSSQVQRWKKKRENINKKDSIFKVFDGISYEQISQTQKKHDFFQKIDSVKARLFDDDDKEPAKLAAKGLQQFYGLYPEQSEIKINEKNIIFTPGGQGGLYNIFNIINRKNPEGYILLQKPYYTLYNRPDNKFLIYDVIENKEDTSTTETPKISFQDAVNKAKKEKKQISMALFCTPNNPSGKAITEQEWELIVKILKDENCDIVIDEAYAELDFSNKFFLLEFIYNKVLLLKKDFSGEELKKKMAPYLHFLEKLMISRSATKGGSTAGERMSLILSLNEEIISELAKETHEMGSPSFSSKLAYSKQINQFKHSRVLDNELDFLRRFYESQVRYVEGKFKEMGVAIKDSNNNYDEVDGAFYVRGNFKSLIGFEIKDLKTQTILQEIGLNGKKLMTDEDIAYYFLVTNRYALTPVSYFGGVPEEGILRITCSAGKELLEKVLNGIGETLKMIQKQKDYPISFSSSVAFHNTTINENPFFSSIVSHNTATNEDDSMIIDENPFNNENKIEEKFISPMENFARWMETYWKEYFSKSEEVIKIRNDHVEISSNRLKNLIKPYFVKEINKILNKLLHLTTLNTLKTSEKSFEKLLGKKGEELLYVIKEIWSYLKNHYILATVGLENNAKFPIVFDQDFEEKIKDYMGNYFTNQKSISKDEERINKRNLISGLVFEKIFYDTLVEGKENPFSEVFNEIYNLEKESINDKFALIEEIVEKHASIDYSHPRGGEENTEMMARALNFWYRSDFISPIDILFVNISLRTLLGKVFENRILSFEKYIKSFEEITEKESKHEHVAILLPNIFNAAGKYIGDIKFQEIVNFVKKNWKNRGDSNDFFIIDEMDVERCVNEEAALGKKSLLNALLENGISKDRIILIRTSEKMFSSENEKISVVIAFDKEIMANFVTVSSNMCVHAPRSLQYAYANAMNDSVRNLFNNNSKYRIEWFQWVVRINKYDLYLETKKNIENKSINLKNLKDVLLEELNSTYKKEAVMLEKTFKKDNESANILRLIGGNAELLKLLNRIIDDRRNFFEKSVLLEPDSFDKNNSKKRKISGSDTAMLVQYSDFSDKSVLLNAPSFKEGDLLEKPDSNSNKRKRSGSDTAMLAPQYQFFLNNVLNASSSLATGKNLDTTTLRRSDRIKNRN